MFSIAISFFWVIFYLCKKKKEEIMWACRLVLWSHQSDRRIRVRISHQSYHSIWISCTNHSVWVLLSFKWCHEIRGCAQRILGSSDERNGLWPLRESRQLRSRFIGIWKLKPVQFPLPYSHRTRQTTYIPLVPWSSIRTYPIIALLEH